MLNAQSTKLLQKCYETDDQSHEQLERMHSQLGMAGQMKVQMTAGESYQLPHSNAPPHSHIEMQQQRPRARVSDALRHEKGTEYFARYVPTFSSSECEKLRKTNTIRSMWPLQNKR
jgi:hypothetical protein